MKCESTRQAEKILENRSGNYILRWLVTFAGAGFIIFLAGYLVLSFLLWNGVNNSTALNSRIINSINSFLGPEYRTRLGVTEVRLEGGRLLIACSSIKIHRSGEASPAVVIRKALVGTTLFSVFYDQPKISSITMESATINMEHLPFAGQSSNLPAIPVNMETSLGKLGNGLTRLQGYLSEIGFRRMIVKKAVLNGYSSASNSTGTLVINEFSFISGLFGKLAIKLDMSAGEAKFNINADYEKHLNGDSTLIAGFDGLNANKWIRSMGIEKNLPAMDANMKGRLDLTFNRDGYPRQPIATIQLYDNEPYSGEKADIVRARYGILNFRVFPELGRIALERSQIDAGKFQTRLTGAIDLTDSSYMLQMEYHQKGFFQKNEKRNSGLLTMEGQFNQPFRQLNISQWKLSMPEGSITGAASIGFGGTPPPFELTAEARNLSVTALKQLLPVLSLESLMQEWNMGNVNSGMITSASVFISDLPVIPGWLNAKRDTPDNSQFIADMEVENTTFNVLDNFPPVKEAYGRIQVDGKQVKVTLEKGNIYTDKGKQIKLQKGKLIIPDIYRTSTKAKASFIAQGEISSLAMIIDTSLPGITQWSDMKPEQWSGQGEVDMIIEFPLKEKISHEEIVWHAIARTEKAESSRLIAGRRISRADLVIDARSDLFAITGDIVIDDIPGSLFMVKSIEKNLKSKDKTIFKTLIDSKHLGRFGINIHPVISGPVNAELTSSGNEKGFNVKADLKNAKISLPWINWSKGAGVPLKASFQIGSEDKTWRIGSLKIHGQDFGLNGDLVFDKNGLKSFDINRIALNKGDNLSASIYRSGQSYNIRVDGEYLDGRALISRLFHPGKGDDRQEKATFNTFKLLASIKQVKGFNKLRANNLIVSCVYNNGWLDSMDMGISFDLSKKVTINADTREKTTHLEIHSEDAGNTLSFLNLYTRMINGKMKLSLKRKQGSPFTGDLTMENFIVIDEPRLKKLVSSKQMDNHDRGERIREGFSKIGTNRARFFKAESLIEAGQGYLKLNGFLTGPKIGLTYDGTLYDRKNQMSLSGTFMPAFGLSKIVSVIPFVGQILSNGQDSGLIGINYHLSGPVDSPSLQLNPLSVVAPGIFKKIFQKSE